MSTMARTTVDELIGIVLDEGSYRSWDSPIDLSGHDSRYRAELEAAARSSGHDESIITGQGTVKGRPVAIVASEFRFLGGSIGVAAAERIVMAVRRATGDGLPLLASAASGGTRMQEGTPAFLRMLEIVKAIMAHKAEGLPYLVHLRHPTTGGALASWGSLGQITIAEPGALVAFLGPKVFEVLHGEPFPEGVQRAENLVQKGVIDGTVPTERLADVLDRALSVLIDPPTAGTLLRRSSVSHASRTWDSVLRTREPQRPGIREILRYGAHGTVQLYGTGEGERDSAVVVALTRLDGYPSVVVGQDRRAQALVSAIGPGALREVRRAMRLANELRLPFVSFIDTAGAELSVAAEERALAREIALCIGTMVTMQVPTVSVLLGQGAGGGALALLPSRRVVAAEHAWLSPLPPEGASAIVYGDATHAAQLAATQQISSVDLLRNGAVDAIVPELPIEEETTKGFASAIVAEVSAQLCELTLTMGKD